MKSKLVVFILFSAALLIAAVFLALPQRPVSAQTCHASTGAVIPCPPKREKKTPRPVPPTRTPTPTPTLTPTPTKPPDAGAGVSANPPGGAPNPGGDKGFDITHMPAWLLWGGLILGLLIVGIIINYRNRLGKSGGERGIIIDGSAPDPGGERGIIIDGSAPDPGGEKGIIINGGAPNPELGGPDTMGDLGAIPPDSGDLGAVPPDEGDLGAIPPDSGDLGATPPDGGDLGATPPDIGDLGSVEPDDSG